MLLSLCACGDSSSSSEAEKEVIKAKITRTDGVEEELSIDELFAIREENWAKFEKYYIGAAVEITHTVESVGYSTIYFGEDTLKNQWMVTNEKGSGLSAFAPDFCGVALEDLSKGDKMFIKSVIRNSDNRGIELMNPTEFYKVD